MTRIPKPEVLNGDCLATRQFVYDMAELGHAHLLLAFGKFASSEFDAHMDAFRKDVKLVIGDAAIVTEDVADATEQSETG